MRRTTRPVLTLALVSLWMAAGDPRAQAQLLDQPPTRTSSGCSDFDCTYHDSSLVIAEDFVLEDERTILEMTIWGGYVDDQAFDDDFLVQIFSDDSGLPDTPPIFSEFGVATRRTPTGFTVGFSGTQVDEYVFTLRLSAPLTLPAGTYWMEIANDSTGQAGDFVWAFGSLDPEHGRAGSAVSTVGTLWFQNSTNWCLRIPEVLFADGFESGDKAAWSAWEP
jgi:hypothetical protein